MISPNRFTRFLLVPLALGVAGCATTGSGLMVPIRPAPPHTLNLVPPSEVRIIVTVALPQLGLVEEHIEKSLKESWDKEVSDPLAKDLGTKTWWDPLDWDFEGNTMTAHLRVHLNLPVPPHGSLGDPASTGGGIQNDIKIDLATVLQWSKNWDLETPGFKTFEPKMKDETETAYLEKGVKSTGHKVEKWFWEGTSKFDERLKDIADYKSRFKEVWHQMQEPIFLDKNIWLQIDPESIGMGSSKIISRPPPPRLETLFEIIAKPQVVFGDKPAGSKGKLPRWKTYQPGPEGFHAVSNLKISYEEVNHILTDPRTGLINRRLSKTGDPNLKITGIRAYGSGGQLVLELNLEYSPLISLSGKPGKVTIYMVGTPRFQPKLRIIDFPDLDFDIKSGDFLLQVAKFFVGNDIKNQLRRTAFIRIGKKLIQLRKHLSDILNRPLSSYATLKTNLYSLKTKEVFVTNDGIEGRVALDGDAMVSVNW